MRSFPIKKLYNPQYDLLSISDKEELLVQIGEIYNLELISLKTLLHLDNPHIRQYIVHMMV